MNKGLASLKACLQLLRAVTKRLPLWSDLSRITGIKLFLSGIWVRQAGVTHNYCSFHLVFRRWYKNHRRRLLLKTCQWHNFFTPRALRKKWMPIGILLIKKCSVNKGSRFNTRSKENINKQYLEIPISKSDSIKMLDMNLVRRNYIRQFVKIIVIAFGE